MQKARKRKANGKRAKLAIFAEQRAAEARASEVRVQSACERA